MMQGKHFVFTLNNYTAGDDDALKALGTADGTTYLVYGYETGESGTPHLQGYVVFGSRKRFNQVKSLLPNGAHIEAKRGTCKQASDYCKKDGIFQEFGSLPRDSSGANVFDDFKQWIVSQCLEHGHPPSEREVAQAYPALYVRYGRKLQDLVRHLCPHVVIVDEPLRDWQVPLFEVIAKDCTDDRGIRFFVDEEGGKGKSYFQRWCQGFFPERVQVLGIGKRDDLAHSIQEDKDIFLINITRGQGEFLNYAILEMLKDRIIFSPKYDSQTKLLRKTPHVVVFMNEAPDLTKMTDDRYLVQFI